MPLPNDEKLIALSNDLLQTFETLFGQHPGFRPAHAKGTMLTGTFTASAAGRSLTRAEHVRRISVPVTVRFSNSTGLPLLPDNDPNADPRGMAIRFQLAEHTHTDIVAHSAYGFPTRTGAEFLEMLRALAASDLKTPSDPANPKPIEVFLGSHPSALAFVQMPKPAPSSFAREQYFGVTAMRFLDAEGKARYGRYKIVPEADVEHLDDAAIKAKGPDYLFIELAERMAEKPVRFTVLVQMAREGDVVDDATKQWPEDRETIELGRIELTAAVTEDVHAQRIIFDPIPRIDGIEPSDDPLLELRAAIYLISGRRRRTAPPV